MIREYREGDWDKVTDAVEPFVPPTSDMDFTKALSQGIAVTGIEKDKVVACGGIIYTSETEGTVWVKMSNKCSPYTWGRTTLEIFVLMKKAVGDLAICTYILKGFDKGKRLAEAIGLRCSEETVEHKGNIYMKMVS